MNCPPLLVRNALGISFAKFQFLLVSVIAKIEICKKPNKDCEKKLSFKFIVFKFQAHLTSDSDKLKKVMICLLMEFVSVDVPLSGEVETVMLS